MKKLLMILVMLFWCNIGFAETKDSMTCELPFGLKKTKVSFKKINDKWAIQIGRDIWVDEKKDEVGGVSTVSVTEHDAELLWTHDEMDIRFHVLIDRDQGIMHTNDALNGKRKWICNTVQSTESTVQRHGKFTSDYICVNALDTEMDITETEGTRNILIGDRNYSDEYIQNLFKKNPEGNISIKHIRSDSYNQIVEVSGMFNIFNGELYFFEIENEGFLSTYLSQGVLIHHMFIHPDENKIRNGKSKRVLGMNLIELSELEYQQLLPLYSKRYHEISKKLNSKVRNGIEPYDDFNKEVDKMFGKDGKIYSDFIISFACFEE